MFATLVKNNFFSRYKTVSFIVVLLFAGAIAGCNNDEKAPDVSNIKVRLQTQRFDRDLIKIDTNNISAGLAILKSKYPDFLDFFLNTLMEFKLNGNYNDTSQGIRQGLRIYLTNKDYRGLFDTIAVHFPDTKQTDEQLQKGFQYLKYYYPNYNVPNVIYMLSWLNNWAAFTEGDHTLCIGLDMFLGGNYPFYKSVGIPDYMANKLDRDYIPVAAFRAIYEERNPFQPDNSTLLDMMIQKGKEMYFINKVLPFIPEETKMGYTTAQLDWCKKNEAQVYNFFIQGKLLYDNTWQKVLRYVTDAPTSTGMPAESPGNIGSWIGFQIVKDYMKEHPQMTLPQLLVDKTDAQAFLQQSGYKPR